ncbi:MAG: hypothetical protein F6J95_020570 [Leptolyngbya sp. SIO1E4]|nr:hypothetical protein [Leptolyngbya sp. SIO1E4]
MKKNDWFPGFLAGVLLIVIEAGYWAQYTGLNYTVSRWVQQMTVSTLVKQ